MRSLTWLDNSSNANRFSKEPKTPSAQHGDDGFRLLESCETDPNAHELPPPPSDGPQAALEALLRGFDVIQLLADGTPAVSDWRSDVIADDALVRERWIAAPGSKVGGVTDGLIVLALTGPEGVQQYAALASITNTAAILSRAHKWILLFFRLPAGVRSVEGELLPGVEILSSYGYLELPSGGVTDGCCWANRYPIAAAPQWLLDQLAVLAASQTQAEWNTDMDAGADAVEMFHKGQINGGKPIAIEVDSARPAAEEPLEISDEEQDKQDTSDIEPPGPPKQSNVVTFPERNPKLEAAPPGLGSHLEQTTTLTTECDTKATIAFLCALDSEGRLDLAAFDPTEGGPDCATFSPNGPDNMKRWLDARQGKANLYVHVNRPRADAPRNVRLNHKKRQEIGRLRAIVADIDVPKVEGGDRSGQHFRSVRERLFKEVVPQLAADQTCLPSYVVDSGGGVQLWYLLNEPALATPENLELFEGIGRTINARIKTSFPEFNTDTVTDAARLMRLPGTINLPNASKKEQGRLPAPTTVLDVYSSENRYSIEQLMAWAPPQARAESGSSEEKLPEIDMSLVNSAGYYEELPDDLRVRFEAACDANSWLQKLWQDGPLTPRLKDISRSGQVFALGKQLKRDGRFTPNEFGQLVWVWEHGYSNQPDKIDARLIGRAWARNDVMPASASGMDKTPIAPCSEATANKAKPAGAEWEEPTDFWAGKTEPPDLPDGVLPEIIERVASDCGRRLGVEAGAIAACFVTTLGSTVSARSKLQMRQKDPQWTVKSILWTAIIADSGSNKSATLKSAMAPVECLEAHWLREYASAKHLYDAQKAKKETKTREPDPVPEGQVRQDGEGDRVSTAVADKPKNADEIWNEGEEPVYRRKIIQDSTTEAMAKLLSKNPDGLLAYFDELAGLFGGMDTYKARSGADRPFWLKAKDGGPHSVDRKTSDPIIVENNAVSVLGAIQPDKLKGIAAELATDGLLQRFLPVILKRIGNGEDDYPDKELDNIVSELPFVISQAEPRRFRFAPEADSERTRVEDFKDQQRARSDAVPKLKEWLDKMPNEYGRVALAFHHIHWAAQPKETRGASPPEIIPPEIAIMARRFMIEFIYPNAFEFYGRMLGRSASDDHATWIAEYILTRGLRTISNRDIMQAHSALKAGEKHNLRVMAMATLEAHGWVLPEACKPGRGPHRWRVNPAVHGGRFADVMDREKARRAAVRTEIAKEAAIRRNAPTYANKYQQRGEWTL